LTQVLWHTDLIAQIALDPWAEAEAEADEYEVFKVIIYLQVCTVPCSAVPCRTTCEEQHCRMHRATSTAQHHRVQSQL
jgi:hypothetical protein